MTQQPVATVHLTSPPRPAVAAPPVLIDKRFFAREVYRHLASAPSTGQPDRRCFSRRTGWCGGTTSGNPWLKGALGDAANAAAGTDTFLGARYRRIVKRRGHAKARVAVARSILVVAWHLINAPNSSYQELAPTGTSATSTRTFGWLMQHRRLARDYEALPQRSRTMIHWAMANKTSRELTGESAPTWRIETDNPAITI